MSRIQILLSDDHPILRSGLRALIQAQPDMEVCGEASDAREAIALVDLLQPDVVIADISMPGGGIHAIKTIAARTPSTRLLVLSMHEDAAYVRSAIAAGAHGYVPKSATHTDLLAAIRKVHGGEMFVHPALAGMVLVDLAGRSSIESRQDILSSREGQVLHLLAAGYTNQQVADRLAIGVKSDETYRARLARKLGLRDRSDFVRYGLESGILQPRPRADTGLDAERIHI